MAPDLTTSVCEARNRICLAYISKDTHYGFDDMVDTGYELANLQLNVGMSQMAKLLLIALNLPIAHSLLIKPLEQLERQHEYFRAWSQKPENLKRLKILKQKKREVWLASKAANPDPIK
eukprot:563484_1